MTKGKIDNVSEPQFSSKVAKVALHFLFWEDWQSSICKEQEQQADGCAN